MRSVRHVACLAVLLVAAALGSAAPPEVPLEVKAPAGKVREIAFKTSPGQEIGFRLVGAPAAFREMKGDAPGERVFWLITETDAPSHIVWWTVGEKGSVVTEINRGAKPVDPVEPDVIPPPKPKPDPKPKPSDGPLRVIFVYETGDSYTTAQQAVLFGDKVRVYLDANAKGWRRFDKDVDATNERDADLKALWAASKGKVTAVPCVVVASGASADILPLPADEAAAIELFRKYGGK